MTQARVYPVPAPLSQPTGDVEALASGRPGLCHSRQA